jgi:uncharacterized repeat protein (TIGR01451 family)
VASAAPTISNATLNGATSVSSPPGGVFEARVTGSGGGEQWGGTQWRFGSGDKECVNTNNSTGEQTVEFDVTSPGAPGDYNAGFTARTNGNPCGGEASAEKVLEKALKVTTPGRNPDIPRRCGINVMLVLDESGSIESSNATEKVRRAVRAFLNALSGTGSAVSIIDFSTTATRQKNYIQVTGSVDPDGRNGTGSIGADFEPYLKNGYDPEGWTNWEDALHEVKVANDATPVADLVMFITDGDPTARNTDTGGTVTNLVEGEAEALRRAAHEADEVKKQNSKMFAVGVGSAVTKQTSARRLTAISGFNQYPNAPFTRADYTLVTDFDDLAQALAEIVAELCGAGITVTKYVNKGDGKYVADEGWDISATVSVPGGFTWTRPSTATGATATTSTDNQGIAKFLWRPTNLQATSTVQLVTETVKDGYRFVRADCTSKAVRRGRLRLRTLPPRSSPPIVTNRELAPGEFLTCAVFNEIIPGTITIEKNATPESSQAFNFTGSLGDFPLVDDGANQSASRTFSPLAPGTYTVREIVPEDWELRGITCTPASAATITGPLATITLAPGGAVTCTYDDLRIDPPVPPEPPVPPAPPPTPPGPPQPVPPPQPPPTPPAGTELNVVKTMPRLARIGRRVRFRLTVTNTGPVAAKTVRLSDLPPGAVNLSALQANRRARLARGQAVWRLGTLAPGASRTIRGSVLITGGTPGRKRNLVLAGAENAKTVSDQADTRLLAPPAPPVTG